MLCASPLIKRGKLVQWGNVMDQEKLYHAIDVTGWVVTGLIFAALLIVCGWFIYLGIDGSFQNYARHMGW
jgi:hypothetical protein